MDILIRVFISLLVSEFILLLIAPSVYITNNSSEQLWLGILLIIAYLLPILLAIYILWRRGYFGNFGKEIMNSMEEAEKCYTKKIYEIKNGKQVLKQMIEICE